MTLESIEPIVNLCKRRGFFVGSSEIYGGVASVFDYGPLGVELKNNLKQLWWKTFIHERDDMVGLDTSIIMNPRVWEASGHLESFTDPLVECTKCHFRFREDHVPDKHDSKFWKCPEGGEHIFTPPRQFNMMFKTFLGAVEDMGSVAYLRPETAQGMFTNFKYVTETTRQKVPFGIAQIGKSFRNEVALGNFIFRLREFEIAELEYFVKPGDDDAEFETWVKNWEDFLLKVGLAKDKLHHKIKPREDLAHYSKATTDIEYEFPFGISELAGIANRTDYDLKRHMEFSGKDLNYFDQETQTKYVPYVIEPTLGIERLILAILCEAYREYPDGRSSNNESLMPKENASSSSEAEIVLHLKPQLAPYKVAVLPLVKKDGLADKGHELAKTLRQHFTTFYDESGSIGRRYRRQDEIGTPWCVTLDYQTVEDNTVTLRDRDTMAQKRIAIDDLIPLIRQQLIES